MLDKYTIFFIGLFVFVPIGIVIVRANANMLNMAFIMLVFGTTQPESLFGLPTDINFLSREWYRGTTRGVEISYLDMLAIIVLTGSYAARYREKVRFTKPPGYKYLKLFFLWSLFTVLLISDPKIFGIFELTKLARGLLIFLAVSVFLRSPEQVRLFVYVLLLIVFYEIAIALNDRYINGIHRVSATFPHPNSFSMYLLQILPIILSICFAPDISSRLKKVCAFASVLIAGGIILTISRTGFAAMIIITFLTILLNIKGRLTAKNIGFLLLVMIVVVAMVIKSWDSIASRFMHYDFENEYLTEEGDRGKYFRKGLPGLYDNPVFGIGLNNWSYWVSNKYAAIAGYESSYYPSTDFPPVDLNRQEAPAHNLFLITAVEIGLVGFVLLLAVFFKFSSLASVSVFSGDGGFYNRLRLGGGLSLFGVFMQSVTEWEFRQTPMFFLGHMIMALIAYLYIESRKVDKT